MNIVKSVELGKDRSEKKTILKILYNNIYLSMPYSGIEHNDRDKLYIVHSQNFYNDNTYYSYNNWDKLKILEIQNILLNAYVLSHDELDKALEDNASINDLNKLRKHVLAVRTHLRYVSKYIIEYEKNKSEIKKDL